MVQCYLIPDPAPSYYEVHMTLMPKFIKCTSCKEQLPPHHFRKKRNQCKACEREYKHFKRYGITKYTYDTYYSEQQGRCAICKQSETAKTPSGSIRKLCVDHNHETHEVRGLLCHACNTLIGLSGENFERLLKAACYVVNRKAVW